jgi:hypothetical protein
LFPTKDIVLVLKQENKEVTKAAPLFKFFFVTSLCAAIVSFSVTRRLILSWTFTIVILAYDDVTSLKAGLRIYFWNWPKFIFRAQEINYSNWNSTQAYAQIIYKGIGASKAVHHDFVGKSSVIQDYSTVTLLWKQARC